MRSGSEAVPTEADLGGRKHLFPLFDGIRGEDAASLVYFDSAATSLMPRMVIDAITEYEASSRSNIHRGIHRMAETSTELYEGAREQLAAHLNCLPENLILTHGTTESINSVARAWAAHNLSAGDVIILSIDNHHANIVPWQMLAREKDLEIIFVEVSPDGTLDHASWKQALSRSPRLVALTQVSNVTGLEHPAVPLIAEAHAAGARVLIDCAQSFGHQLLDLTALGADMAVASCHKAYGPFGLGFLFCSDITLGEMYPCYGGGGMIAAVTKEGFSPAVGSSAFEAGTPVVSAAAGLKASLDFMDEVGLEVITRHTAYLSEQTRRGLRGIDGIHVIADRTDPRGKWTTDPRYGTCDRCSIVSFTSDSHHPHDLAACLDEHNIAVRAGHHCAMPLHNALDVMASVRVSFGIYNDMGDVERFLGVVRRITREERHGIAYRHRR